MPQTTVTFPNSTVSAGGTAAAPTAWTNPNNAQADDATNATSTAAALIGGTQVLTASQFNALAEEAAMRANSTGQQIPAGASILGVRFSYDADATNTGVLTLNYPGGSTTKNTAQSIVTVGFGTLSSGSTVAAGNTYQTFDLSTAAGQTGARAKVDTATLTPNVIGAAGTTINTAAYGMDFFSVTISWVLYKDGAGSPFASAFASGVVFAVEIKAGVVGSATAFATGTPFATEIKTGDVGSSTAFATGAQKPLITMTGTPSRTDAFSSGVQHSFFTLTNSARADAFMSTTITQVQVTQGASGLGLAFATGTPFATEIKTGDVGRADAFASGAPKPLITMSSSSPSTAFASGVQKPLFTLGATGSSTAYASGIARAYSFAISGYSRDATGSLLPSVRVDVYRKSDHAWMGRITSDASTAYYSLALPFSASVFWCRFYLVGPPDLFDTTIDDLALVQSQVQGPP